MKRRATPLSRAFLAVACTLALAASNPTGASTPGGAGAGATNPPVPSRDGSGGKPPRVMSLPPGAVQPNDGLEELFKGNPKASLTLLACDQFQITYSLLVNGGQGTVRNVTGSATNTFACGWVESWPIEGTLDVARWHLHIRVTNPIECFYQYYTFDGYGRGNCNCFQGRYCWNSDGVWDSMTLSPCYK